MSREQRIPPRRQFMRPLSLIHDSEPAAPPETSAPLSQPVMGEQTDLTKFSTLPTPAVKEPASSPSWEAPQPRQQTSGLFSGPSNTPLPPQEANSAWAMLQGERQYPAPADPISSSAWEMAQLRPQTSGLFSPSTAQEASSAARAMLQGDQQLPSSPTTSNLIPWVLPTNAQQNGATQAKPLSPSLPQTGQSSTLSQMVQAGPFQAKIQTEQLKPELATTPPPVQQQKGRKSLKKQVPIWFAACSVIVVIVIVLNQGNGTMGAWAADTFRSIIGPVATAQIEAWYLNAQNKVQQWQFQASGQHVASPWKLTPTTTRPTPTPTPPAWSTMKPMPLSQMQPIVSPALDGEGTWNVLEQAQAPYNYLPLSARAFIRPDPAFPYAVVTLLQFDARFSRLHVVSGTQEPGGPVGMHGAGIIAPTDRDGNALLAALNGGFKYADGAYGLMTNGVVYVRPQPNTATIAITRQGNLVMGAWGVDPQLKSGNKDLLAWRQNASLLIDKGVINPLTKDGAAWGGTILNSEYTWRSGLGVTAQGNLVYAAGNALVPETLGKALQAAGAVMAMETDINPFWVRAFLYQRGNDGKLSITKLNPQMQGTGYEYLNVDQRDFFYLTRYAPPINGATPTPTSRKKTVP